MKRSNKNTKNGVLIIALLATLLNFATTEAHFKIKNDAKKRSLILNNVKEGNVLCIKDNNNVLLYKEVILSNGIYAKNFDLSSLPNGSYYFELDKEIEVRTIPFTITETATFINRALETITYKPISRLKGDILYVSRFSFNKEPLKVDIYFKDDLNESGLVFSENIESSINIGRIYKLTGINNGTYSVVYTSKYSVFTEEINSK